MNEMFVSIKADWEEFRSEFIETNRSTVNVCPGVTMHYRWSRSEALDLDDHDRLTEEIDERVQEVVATWETEGEWEMIRKERVE